MRDSRAETGSSPEETRRRRTPSRPRVEPVTARVALVEAELSRLKEERGAEADELAKMLVRIADAERSRAAAEGLAEALTVRVRELETRWEDARRELEASRQDRQHGAEMTQLAARRAGLAEQSAADGAAALDRAHAELEADRARASTLDAKLAQVRREHTDELAAQRAGHAEASHRIARILEEERSAAARTRQQVAILEADLGKTHALIGRAAALVEEIERREEMVAALRTRSLEQTRRVLAGEAEQPLGPHTESDEPLDFTDG